MLLLLKSMPIKVRKLQKVYEGLYDLDGKPYNKPLYKYMDMGAAIKCIKDGSLRFVEPSCWKDQFEKLFYINSSLKFEIKAKQFYAASQRVL